MIRDRLPERLQEVDERLDGPLVGAGAFLWVLSIHAKVTGNLPSILAEDFVVVVGGLCMVIPILETRIELAQKRAKLREYGVDDIHEVNDD